jgi:type I restriction enzyme S subunit
MREGDALSLSKGWKEVRFGDIAQFPPKIKMSKGEVYPFIPMEELSSGIKYVKPVQTKELSGGGAKFEEGDTLFARITPCLQNGKIAQAKNLNDKPGFGSTEYFVFRGLDKISDTDYIYYLSQTEEFRENAINSMVGASGRQRADAGHVKKFQFLLPPLETQRKIASVLSGYDDLIENNLKRIKILEEMAQQTYEEWFVRMRFPGYETAVMNEETGLPEGWEKKVLRDLGNIITGKTPSTTNELFYNGDIPFIKTPDMNNSIYVIETNQNLTEAGSNNQKGKLICKNSLVVSCIGSAGVYSLVSKPSQFNQQINAITFNSEEYIYFTYGFVKGLKEKLEALGSNGATMTNVNKTKFEQIEIIIPNEDLLNNFHNKVKNNFESILNLQSQNQRLRESRDILLPRLMMGMIEV